MSERIYSFSCLNIFETCKYAWYLTYMEKRRGENNCFAEYGTIFHDLIEKIEKNKVLFFETKELFEKRFDNMVYPFPEKFKKSYREKGKKYFEKFDGLEDFTMWEMELEYFFEIAGYKFRCFPDYVGEKNNELYIIDFKTSKPYSSKDLQEKLKQLYMYSIPIATKYNRYPDKLKFDFTKENDAITIPFDEQKLEETKKWAVDVIKKIEQEKDFKPTINQFYCNNLCNHRNYCKFNQSIV